MKVTVVGAGSTYTPELVEGFVTHAERLPIDELALLDVDGERLDVVSGVSQRILRRSGWAGRVVSTTERDAALDGASFVVVQIRVGGQAARLADETIAPRFGCIGQETTGPCGFAKALRTVPVVLELAEEVAARGTAGAWMVDFTNPVGIVTQALLDEGHRAIGLCNVAIGLQRMLAGLLGVEWEQVGLEHVGLNHLSWERAVRVDDVDVLSDLLADHAGPVAGHVQVVDVRNGGAIRELAPDAVVEIPARVDADGAHPAPLEPLAPEIAGLMQEVKAYERLAVRAATMGSRSDAVRALMANPLVPSFGVATRLADALLEANRSYLPRFFPDGETNALAPRA